MVANLRNQPGAGLNFAKPTLQNGRPYIAAPPLASFTSAFGHAFPTPYFLTSSIGSTAVYDLAAPSNPTRRVLMIHGLNTPALGMLSLAHRLQALDPGTHIVLYDLWGHGLTSTPLQTHTSALFHAQMLQVLSYMKWHEAHIVGFSFGGSTAVSFALSCPWVVQSTVLLAPAGLIQWGALGERVQGLLRDDAGREEEARSAVLDMLEGGKLTVPDNWRERSRKGEVVVEALRQWELDVHQGYKYSVFSMFRDGGAMGCEEEFGRFGKEKVKKLVMLGEKDDLCAKEQLVDLGFEGDGVKVVVGAGHALGRTHTNVVADLIGRFWGGM